MTAFEPSGDALGGMAVEGLLAEQPDLPVAALGGASMAAAGAEVLENTVDDAVMGVGAIAHAARIRRHVAAAENWMAEHNPSILVAVDSPAANFHVCIAARRHGMRIVHLAAPQIWAWGGWRLGKLRRLTDHLLCLLPFEEQWFLTREIPATFIGHPAMNVDRDGAAADLPASGEPRLLLLPGSRRREIAVNLPLQLEALERLGGVAGAVACRGDDAQQVSEIAGGLPTVVDDLPGALRWADCALCVSGTVTLHAAAAGVPMVGMYRASLLSRMGATFLLRTKDRLLPNLIAQRRIVPEFVPCGKAARAISAAISSLLEDAEAMDQQRRGLAEVCELYAGHDPAAEAAAIIVRGD